MVFRSYISTICMRGKSLTLKESLVYDLVDVELLCVCEGKGEQDNSMAVVPKNVTTKSAVQMNNQDISSMTTIFLLLVVFKKVLVHRYYVHAKQMIWSKDMSSNQCDRVFPKFSQEEWKKNGRMKPTTFRYTCISAVRLVHGCQPLSEYQ